MERKRTDTKMLVVFFTLALVAMIFNWSSMEKEQKKIQFNVALTEKDVPATLVLTTQAVGPFRGLIANGLWWRSLRMQEEGNYFEAIQLASWITNLQPKLSSVWTYQAWNMVYNVSVEVDEPSDRWKWVYEGIKLLRNNGLKYNPRDPFISIDVSRYIMEKLGKSGDKDARYFRWRWALEMERYFKQGDRAELQLIIEAATTRKELEKDPLVLELINLIQSKGDDPFSLKFHNMALPDYVNTEIADDAKRDAYEHLNYFVRRRDIMADLRLDATHMILIDDKYGPFDWRLYHAHVVYWGAEESFDMPEGRESYQFPYVRQAIVNSLYNGRFLYSDDKGISTSPNVEIIKNAHQYLATVFYEDPEANKVAGIFRDFHEMGVILLYTFMYTEDAEELYEDYRNHFMSSRDKAKYTFESFIVEKAPLVLTQSRSDEAGALITSALFQAYFWSLKDDLYRARGYENLALVIYKKHQRTARINKKKPMPPFSKLKKDLVVYLKGSYSPLKAEMKDKLKTTQGTEKEIIKMKDLAKRKDLGIGTHHE